jgi:hypothetical protein
MPSSCPTPSLQPHAARQRGALQLLDSLDAAAAASAAVSGFGGSAGPSSASTSGGVAALPPGFLEDFAARFAEEGLTDIVAPIGELLAGAGSCIV